jgi:hypothetical protein
MRRGPRAEHLLPIACAAAAALLFASQFMNIFQLDAGTPPVPGQTFDRITAIDQHSIAVLLLATFAFVAVIVCVVTGSRPAAYGVAAAGVAALLIFLLRDLPDAGKAGSVNFEAVPLADATNEPVLGFWIELTASLVLAVCGGALATLTSQQLGALGRVFRGRGEREKDSGKSAGHHDSDPLRTATDARDEPASSNSSADQEAAARRAARSKPG